MFPSSTVPEAPDTRPPLVCTCRMRLTRNGDPITVQARAWDCPSCGLDKRRTLTTMVETAAASVGLLNASPVRGSVTGVPESGRYFAGAGVRMWTFTMEQPPAVDADGVALVPEVHRDCDWSSHVYRYRDGSLRWRTLSSCPFCCKRVSRMLDTLTKWVRRRFPAAQRLWVREDQKNGSLHIHSAWAGVPYLGRKSRFGAQLVRYAVQELGFGRQVDLGREDGPRDSSRVGWYIGKYLAKQHDGRMAHGYRRWSRSRGFAPDVRMARNEPPEDRPAGVIVFVGWLDPSTGEVAATRTRAPD
jgi:hypothetical protein